ncbi:hypothetical protein HYV57_03475 [Candidatus Peregrinibacteria bacterium]|nr:hypothetical protein [Candidatus Peregrinibacteria bacterium]
MNTIKYIQFSFVLIIIGASLQTAFATNDTLLTISNAVAETSTPCTSTDQGLCVDLREPLGDQGTIRANSGLGLVQEYVKAIYQWAAGLIGIVAVLNMVIAGIQITTSADSERAASAKTRIMQSIAAICVLFLSGLILYTINPNFFVTQTITKEETINTQAEPSSPSNTGRTQDTTPE